MGAVEETRKLMQDFLAPEPREIKARIEALGETTSARLEALEQTSAVRREAVMGALTHLANYSVLSERLGRLEAQKESKAS
jgi:hypothetical protein